MNNGSSPLILRKLAIRRLAGLASGFSLDELSPGVNVIFGPNGVGKSRTALALNLAFWPNDPDQARRDAVSGWFDLGPESWAVDIDAGEVNYQLGGAKADRPNLPGIEIRDRYNLPLHELLASHGDEFAAAISRESAGGFDLSAAAAGLGIDKKPAARPKKETDALVQSSRLVQERRQKLDTLRRREQELAELIRQRDSARVFAGRIPRLQAALALDEAVRNQELAGARVASFPAGVAKLSGQEAEQLRQFRADIATKKQGIERAGQELNRAREALAAARFADEPPNETVISTLTGLGRELVSAKNKLAVQEQEVKAATARRAAAARAIGPLISEEKLERLDLRGIDELATFAREAEKTRADLTAVDSVRRWLTAALPSPTNESAANDDVADVDRLSEGLRLLARWLRQPTTTAPPTADDRRWLVLSASGLVVLLSLLLAWQWHPAAAIFALAAPLLLFFWTRRRTTSDLPGDARPLLQQQYASLRLNPPAAWSPDGVEEMSQLLFDRLSAAKLRKERADRLADQGPQFDAAEQRARALATRREQLAARLGVAPITNESLLYALVESVVRWQQAASELFAATARLTALHAQYEQTFTSAANLLQPFGYDVRDPAAVDAASFNLRDRCEAHRTQSATIAQLTARIEDLQREFGQICARRDAVFTAIGLPAGDDQTLEQWLDLRAEYESAKSTLAIATAKAAEIQNDLREESDLIKRPPEELQVTLDDCQEKQQSLEVLTEKIAGIRREINLAKEGSDLEDAQAKQREAAAALAASRSEDCDLAAGWVLLEHLRNVSGERHQSAVFRRAREIFARVTRGRYELQVADDAGSPAFRCIDRERGLGQSLDELSSGTRVQLLLAVRVAFVEQQEQGPRLPLILDETLANSDETRARQILDAIIEICRGGRQIFYFTAQPDEVGKWKEVLDSQIGQDALPYRLIDLAAVRGLAESEHTPPRQIVTPPAAVVPPPGNLDRQAYGQLLQVPGIDPWQETAGSVHLWYLIDDLPTLHQLLSMGIRSWGQWKTMAEVGGLANVGAGDVFARADARARLLESLARLWRVGRGKPVDRQAIADSKVISQVFLEPVVELAMNQSSDARRLVARLKDGAIPRFQRNTADKLSGWLQDAGYLDPRDPLSPDEMRLHAAASCVKELQSGHITMAHIDQNLATWFTQS